MDMSELSFYEVIVVGSCNVELFCYADRLPKSDQSIVGTRFNISYGGKGGNMCVSAAKLGCTCALIARLGNDCFGKDYVTRLKKLQIDASRVLLTDNTASGIAQITVTNNGANHVILIPNANNCLSCADIDKSKSLFKNAKIGLFSCEIPAEVVIYALKVFKAQGGKKSIFAPFGDIDREAYKLANIVVLNISELANVTGDEITSITDARYSLKKLLKLGCETGVVTLGCRGALFMSRCHENPTRVFVTPVDRPVDTTGAGAAFVGSLAFLMIHYEGMKFEDQVRIACEIARETVLKMSSQDSYPFRRQIAHLLPSDYC